VFIPGSAGVNHRSAASSDLGKQGKGVGGWGESARAKRKESVFENSPSSRAPLPSAPTPAAKR
jgi:hypothetical protein